jgi:hypothetical protein
MRLSRFHLLDNVRGQTLPFLPGHVEAAGIATRVARVSGDSVLLLMRGRSRARERGRWKVRGIGGAASAQERGFEAEILGMGLYDRASERFTVFELVAIGTRWGGTQYNERGDDLGPSPMGLLFRLAGDTPADRVPPAHFWAYGW